MSDDRQGMLSRPSAAPAWETVDNAPVRAVVQSRSDAETLIAEYLARPVTQRPPRVAAV